MFRDQTAWLDEPCHYVVATHGHRRAWLAGPYRTAAEADAILPWSRHWALLLSGDSLASEYEYEVFRHYNGERHSILGVIVP